MHIGLHTLKASAEDRDLALTSYQTKKDFLYWYATARLRPALRI